MMWKVGLALCVSATIIDMHVMSGVISSLAVTVGIVLLIVGRVKKSKEVKNLNNS